MKMSLNSRWSILDGGSSVIESIETVMNQNNLPIPWADSNPQPNGFDYHFNRSGGKLISPFLMTFGNDVLTETERQNIARVVVARYYKSWVKEYDTLNQSYNMLENFNGIETETFSTTETQKTKTADTGNTHQSLYQQIENDETVGSTVTDSKTGQEHSTTLKSSDTENINAQHERIRNIAKDDSTADKMGDKYNGDTTHERHTKSDAIKDVYGFNTTEINGVPSERSEANAYSDNSSIRRETDRTHDTTNNKHDESDEKNGVTHGTTTVTDDTTVSGSTQESNTTTTSETKGVDGKTHDYGNTSTSQHGISDMEHHNITQRDLHRHGNLGVTTSQQMIQSERELWLWEYCEYVYECIDKILTSPYFA